MSKIAGKWIGNVFEQEVPTGLVNGSNTSYSLSSIPQSDKSVIVFLNGLAQRYTTDFTVSGSTITMVNAPSSGVSIFVFYIKR